MPTVHVPPKRPEKPRGVRFCKSCGRKHGTNEVCKLYARTKTAKSGKQVKRWAA